MDKVKLSKIPKWIGTMIEGCVGYEKIGIFRALLTCKNIELWSKKEHGNLVKLAQAIEYGYEVEEDFKVGDWVVYEYSNLIGKIIEKPEHNYLTDILYGSIPQMFTRECLRIATTEEIEAEKKRRADEEKKVWSDLGREVNEYRKGDIVEYDCDFFFVNTVEEGLTFKDCSLVEIRNAHGCRQPSARDIHMVCPVEQRLDKKE